MRRASDRSVLSRAKPEYLFRLARWIRGEKPTVNDEECYCQKCITALIEYLARELERIP
jgi:hypothetical protein